MVFFACRGEKIEKMGYHPRRFLSHLHALTHEIKRIGEQCLTLWGAIYLVCVCLMPDILVSAMNVPFYFGGTSLLIVVVVTMDFMAQVQSHMMSHQYESLLKKANLKTYGRSGSVR